MFGVPSGAALTTAAAVECVHCYSLVHDDLPAMDNDDLRRGKPTVHKAFDEWTAILAGDALLTVAFGLLASPDADHDPAVRAELVCGLAAASGAAGMVGGQCLDLEADKLKRPPTPDLDHVRRLQAMKTGASSSLPVTPARSSVAPGSPNGRRLRATARSLDWLSRSPTTFLI